MVNQRIEPRCETFSFFARANSIEDVVNEN